MRVFLVALFMALTPAVAGAQETDTQAEQGQTRPEQDRASDSLGPIRIEIVEDEAEANARKSREERAEQRELDDLAAQEGMDEATRKMADYALYQTILVGIGTALLFYTLYLTRQANQAAVEAAKASRVGADAAHDANEIASKAYKAQLRAYMIVESMNASYVLYDDGTPAAVQFTLILRNGGATPAIQIAQAVAITEARADAAETTRLSSKRSVISFDGQGHRPSDVGPGMPLTVLDEEVLLSQFTSYRHNKTINCNVRCFVTYKTVVGSKRRRLIANFWVRSRSVSSGFTISRSGPQEST